MKTILCFVLVAVLIAANGCLFNGKHDKEPEPRPVPVEPQPEPKPEPKVRIPWPDIPLPDQETAEKIEAALEKYQDEDLSPGERQDALLREIAEIGTISFGEVLRLLGDPDGAPEYSWQIHKFFRLRPDAARRDEVLVMHLFNESPHIRTGAIEILRALYPGNDFGYDPDASDVERYRAIKKWKKAFKIKWKKSRQ